MALLNTAITGLLTSQRQLATTSHNIANVNTPGYSRQRVELVARQAQFTGAGFVGKGVETSMVVRIQDQFLTTQLRTSTSAESEARAFFSLANRIDSMLADDSTGIGPTLQNFFNSLQDVTDLPSSISARQVLLSEAESLTARFQFLDDRFSDIANEVRTKFSEDIAEINTLAQSISDLNIRIISALGASNFQPPNDLLDQREEVIRQLSELVSVTTTEQSDGAVNVFIGKGQPLVLSANASKLSVSETYQGHFDITLTDSFTSTLITDSVSGGELGGLLDFQSQMLEPSRNELGRLAIGLADTFNDQHRLGLNLDNEINTAFFNLAVPDIIPLGAAPNNVTSAIVDPSQLSASDYNLTFTGGNNYTLTRLSDGQTTAINTGGTSPFTTATIDGFTLTITAGAAVNDQFIIRPTVNGGRDISVAINDPNKIAAAGPLGSAEATNASGLPTNTGTGSIGEVSITSTTGLPLTSPITMTFNSGTNQFTVSAPPGGTLAYNPATESGGKQFTFAGQGNATFTISGVPANGDQFVIQNNTGANGDNRNALSLSDLQSSRLLLNGTATYQDTYGQLVADVGTLSRQSEISTEALGALLTQANEVKQSVSGVSLDEEAADMLRFQQSYQAAAQVIAIANNIFETLLNSTSR